MSRAIPLLPLEKFTVTSVSSPEEVHEFCLEKFGMTPHFMMAVLSKGLPNDLHMGIEWDYDPKYGEWAALTISVRNKKNKLVARDYRLVDEESKKTWPGDLHVDASLSGQGIGTLLAFNQMRLINHMGVPKMLIKAGDVTGAAFWGRLGFDLENEQALLHFNKKILAKRLEIMSGFLGEDFVHHAYEACEALDRGSVWPLTDLDQDIITFYKKDKTMTMLRMMNEEYVDITVGEVTVREAVLSAGALARFENRGVITLGQVLLVGQQWYGVFDFSSQRQLDRLALNVSAPLGITPDESVVQQAPPKLHRRFRLG